MEPVSQDFMFDLRKLRLLRELDRHGTVIATAQALHLTPSAVSQQLAGLAREVGVPLLERRGRGVVLTSQARVLIRHGGAVLEELARTRAALDSWSNGTVGEVRVGSLSTGIGAMLGPAIVQLRQERPALEVSVDEEGAADSLERLDAGELDLIVTVDHPGAPSRSDARYVRLDLVADVMDVALPKAHPLAAQAVLDLADLAAESWVGPASNDLCGHVFYGACASAGFTPDVRHHCQEWDAVAALVAAGAGIALIPRLAQPLRQEGVVLRPLEGAPATRILYALARAGNAEDAGIAAVLEALADAAAVREDGLIRT